MIVILMNHNDDVELEAVVKIDLVVPKDDYVIEFAG